MYRQLISLAIINFHYQEGGKLMSKNTMEVQFLQNTSSHHKKIFHVRSSATIFAISQNTLINTSKKRTLSCYPQDLLKHMNSDVQSNKSMCNSYSSTQILHRTRCLHKFLLPCPMALKLNLPR